MSRATNGAHVSPVRFAEPVRLLLISPVRMYREGLARLLQEQLDVDTIATSESGPEALRGMAEVRPTVVLLDMASQSALETARALHAADPAVAVVAVGVDESEQAVLACAQVEVAGYVPRSATVDTLVSAIESVSRGALFFPGAIAAALFRRLASHAAQQRSTAVTSRLTAREREIAGLIDQGLSNKTIAGTLGIGLPTVKNHVHNILEKLRARGRREATTILRSESFSLRSTRSSLDPR